MPLASGARLGPYEVVTLVGAGAMGEVYRARDPRLGRDVAIKVLPSAFAGDADRLSRFEQEARAAAALNHPNILAVFDIGRYAGSPYIVSELLEGETLREVLGRSEDRPLQDNGSGRPLGRTGMQDDGRGRPLGRTGMQDDGRGRPLGRTGMPVRKAIEYAVQIAHGLTAAHEKGIVHRDLKPDNIFIATGDRVKILDFGLAKLTEPEPVGGVGSVVPTVPPATEPGTVLGTLGYMSPEQVRGIPADYRSDIFSFGAILYEMLLGQPAFQRDTAADTMSAILKEPAEITTKARQIPPPVARIVERCLEKVPAMRFQSTADLAFALAGALSAGSTIQTADGDVAAPRTNRRSIWIGGAAAVVAMAAVATAGVAYLQRSVDDDLPVKLNVTAPQGVVQTDPAMRVSPDGTRLVFAATTSEGVRRLWLRPLNSLDASALGETEGATNPFWSADSRSLGYFSGGQLKRIDIADGSPATLCAAPQAAGGTWNADGVIVFSSGGQLRRVSASGGAATLLGGVNGKREGSTLAYPTFLPDGRHILYLDTGSGGVGEAAVYAAALDSSERTLVLRAAASNAWYSRGYLFFLRDTTLVAQPFDPNRLTLSGDAVPIVEQVQRTPFGAPSGAFSVSEKVLAYRTGIGARGFPTQLNWFDPGGKVMGTVGERADYGDVELSPDGTRALVSELDPGTGRDVWVFDLARGIPTRVTTDPADEFASVWSPDGSQIIFSSRRKGHFDLYQKASSGAGATQDVLVDNRDKWPMSWSSDGRTLLYSSGNISVVGNRGHLWALPLVGDRKPFPVLDDPQFTQYPGRLSPDGRWIAYASTESGQSEIYVTSFPSLTGKWRISTSGGNWPRWRHDGKEIFFLSDNTKLMAAEVNGAKAVTGQSAQFSVGAVHMLFEARWRQGARYSYDVASDGRIFGATLVEPPPASPITLVVNWLADLKK